ncbi:MAG: hypothetical protein MR210_09270 [Erysipelotrichaceae bacterium]|nr:hypothetical protein [Erysipelotrichaceae bacterium]MDY5252994.1 hypothetical protein [Erysipelotrichaceae bacterium]
MVLLEVVDRYICKQDVDFNDQQAEKNYYYFDKVKNKLSNSDKIWFTATGIILTIIFISFVF